MNQTKIEWCDSTWNPVTGCLYGCNYCYARKQANRFAGHDDFIRDYGNNGLHEIDVQARRKAQRGKDVKAPYPFNFSPTFHRYRLDEPQQKKKPQNIFVCSMADLFGEWIPDSWVDEVFKACEKAPQHNCLFLTKNPNRYVDLLNSNMLPRRNNMWYGETVTSGEIRGFETGYNFFVSVEPMQGEAFFSPLSHINWIILGAETGSCKGKTVPKKEWIDNIVKQCQEVNVPVFMKDSLIPIVGEENMLRKLPENLKQKG